jgi:hypothetical protein
MEAGVGPLDAVAAPVLPAAIASAPGVTTAGAPPVLVNVRVTAKGKPRAIPVGIDSAPVTAAAATTVTLVLAAFDVTTRDGLFASVPEAEADRENVPTVGEEQLAYWNTTGVVPGGIVAETGDGAGRHGVRGGSARGGDREGQGEGLAGVHRRA